MIGKHTLRAIISRTGCKLIARHNGRAFAVPAFANDIPAPVLSPPCAGGSQSRGPSGRALCGPAVLTPFMVKIMHGKAPTVSCLFGPPRQKSYRMAVADVLRAVKREHGLSMVELADRLGCSDQTIRNAMDEDGHDCLSAVTMLRIGFEFGEDALEPVFALARRAVVEPTTPTDRVERIERELAALLRECGE